MKQILDLELLVLGLVLPEPLLLVRSPLGALIDGLLQGMAPYVGGLQEDGQIMTTRDDGGPIDGVVGGILGLVVGQGMDVHVAIEKIPPRYTSLLGLARGVRILHGLGLVQEGLEDSRVVLVGCLARCWLLGQK